MAAEIALIGATPTNMQRSTLGVFKKTASSVDGRPVYRVFRLAWVRSSGHYRSACTES